MAKNTAQYPGESTLEITCKQNCSNYSKLCSQCCYRNKKISRSEFKPRGVR